MSKALFRFLRGELNGFYVTRMHGMMNGFTSDVRKFLASFRRQQFRENEIGNKNLYGLGRFAGIFLPRMAREESISSLRMTESFVNGGEECSERGLFLTEKEQFVFYPDVAGDINAYATVEQRSSLVGDDEVVGYISSEEDGVLDDDGKVIREKILPEPPSGVAYSEFYGDKFLFLSEAKQSYSNLEPSLYIELYKALQWIRYNGVSIASLCRVIDVICPKGLVRIDHIENAGSWTSNIYYRYYDDVDVELKAQRLSLLEYIVRVKFVQARLVEIN